MSLLLQNVSNTDHHFSNSLYFGESSKNTIKENVCNLQASAIDTIDDDETIYGDDERSVVSSDIDSHERNSSLSGENSRSEAPAIFFGTPCQAEHERRAKYSTKMRDRRLLRRDSLDLARRKSISSSIDQGKGPSTDQVDRNLGQFDVEDVVLRRASLEANCIGPESREDLLQHVSLEDDWETESNAEDESAEFDVNGGDTTVRLEPRKATSTSSFDDSTSFAREDIPSTPIKHGIPTSLSRQSLNLSDADSSPGMALALERSSFQHSPFQRSPLQCRDENIDHSPEAFRLGDLSPCKLDNLHNRPEKLSPFTQRHNDQNALDSSLRKLSRSASPSKNPPVITSTSSPVKAAVRQTLSAWAHAKLETPQSPEKKEWERDYAHLISPSREKKFQSSDLPSSDAAPIQSGLAAVRTDTSTRPVQHPPNNVKKMPNINMDKQIDRPIRPLPASRIPKPVKRPFIAKAPVKPIIAARRIDVAAPVTPSSVRIRNNLSLSAPRPDTLKPSNRLMMSAPARSPFKLSTGPFASRQLKEPPINTQPTTLRSLLTSSIQSSPNKVSSGQINTRPIIVQSSSPSKRMPFVSSKAKIEPMVRDAKLAVSKSRHHVVHASPVSSIPHNPQQEPTTRPQSIQVRINSEAGAGVEVDNQIPSKQLVMSSMQNLRHESKRHDNSKSSVEPKRRHRNDKVSTICPAEIEGQDVKTPFASLSNGPILDKSSPIDSDPSINLDEQKVREKRQEEGDRKIVPSKALERHIGKFMPISRSELSRLTSLNTRQNEILASQIETIVIRKKGENRPASPSSKIRRSQESSSRRPLSQEASKKAREDRAKKRIGEGRNDDKVDRIKLDVNQVHNDCHFLGAGELSIYVSPPRFNHARGKSVRWQKSLVQNRRKENSGGKMYTPKSCLSSIPFTLDRFGNVNDKKPIWSPTQKQRKVIVYKIVYDDDEQ